MDTIVKEMEDAAMRKKALGLLVEKRSELIDYLKRLYHGEKNLHYLNIVRIDPQLLLKDLEDATIQKRAKNWFILGYNLAPMIRIENPSTFVRSLSQLIEEFDYLVDHDHSSISNSTQMVPSQVSSINLDNDDFKPKIHKVGSSVNFEFLRLFNIVRIPILFVIRF
eukprot:TRINITY_DN7662_c0_g1_i1.p1 TRINITY_DN7662_c0_g1~~TRINITY_DN7662_c0_g1_i1.p1  ORF type:complete len:166 (+),score=59.42 TRINITY_DN7662_c0_g1_i1:109-606(+)